MYKEAVAKYKPKCSRKEKFDIRALNEWECKVNECIEKRIRSLKSRHINRRKKHILKSEKHLRSLQELHSMYVLVKLNNATFHSAITDIYPHKLQLKKTTECETQLSYLDVLITIENGKYSTAVYDKRDNFNFNIVNFPYLSSNIPSGPAYGVYTSQLVRIGRICSNYTEFARRHYKLTQRLIHQDFRYSALCLTFKRFSKKIIQVLDKYGCSI